QTGAEALAILRDGTPVQVALIDGFLPDMHGMRLARAIVDDGLAQPVALCFVTGGISQSSSPEAGVAVLSKPMRLKELLAMVGDLLRWRDGAGSPPDERRAALERFELAFVAGP
ncbi:MAG: response regulator, partial [Candidatus Dormibacteraeota bacterium]|nr:response regulator [Candidatus Dormibacteraeota bacterium]